MSREERNLSDKDYGLEDICESLDGIEGQLKKIVAALEKLQVVP